MAEGNMEDGFQRPESRKTKKRRIEPEVDEQRKQQLVAARLDSKSMVGTTSSPRLVVRQFPACQKINKYLCLNIARPCCATRLTLELEKATSPVVAPARPIHVEKPAGCSGVCPPCKTGCGAHNIAMEETELLLSLFLQTGQCF